MTNLKIWHKKFAKRGLPVIVLLDIKNKSMEIVDPEDVEYITNNVVEIYGRGLYFDFGNIIFFEGIPMKIFVSGYPEADFLEFLRPAQLEKVKQELIKRKEELEQHLTNLQALVNAGILKEKDLQALQEEYDKISQILSHFEEAIQGATLAEKELEKVLEKVDTLSPQFYMQALYSRIGRYINFNELWAQVGSLSNKVFLAILLNGILTLVILFVLFNNFITPTMDKLATSMAQLAQAVKQLQAINQTVNQTANQTVITLGLILWKRGNLSSILKRKKS